MLSEQERIVLRLIACGYTENQICGVLRISPHTVDEYRRRIFRKLGAVSSPNAVALGMKSQQITDDDVTPFPSPVPLFRN